MSDPAPQPLPPAGRVVVSDLIPPAGPAVRIGDALYVSAAGSVRLDMGETEPALDLTRHRFDPSRPIDFPLFR